jgi:hypothetical protein
MDVRRYLRAQWDRVLAIACVVLGALALLLGWLGVSGTALSYKQLPYLISGGLVGVVLIGLGATIYLSADLRDEWRKLDRLEERVDRALDALEFLGEGSPSANGGSAGTGRGKTARARARGRASG